MARKKLFRGIRTLMLIGSLVLAGCDGIINPEEDGYTFKFKVDNNTDLSGGTAKTITKVEFINGDARNDTVLDWSSKTLDPGERSMQHTARGFTTEYTTSARIFGVQVTFDDDSKVFNWSSAGHGSKILVSVDHPGYYNGYYNQSGIRFSPGNW
jgi:hypothetical protein